MVDGVAAMSELARFDDRAAMERASLRFVRALRGEPLTVQALNDEWLPCGHERRNLGAQGRCRLCLAQDARAARLADQIEGARAKLARLEREARERGQVA